MGVKEVRLNFDIRHVKTEEQLEMGILVRHIEAIGDAGKLPICTTNIQCKSIASLFKEMNDRYSGWHRKPYNPESDASLMSACQSSVVYGLRMPIKNSYK